MKVLITGAEGFIGSHLTEALVKLGYDVRAFVLYNSFSSYGWLDKCDPAVHGKFEVFLGDIRDPHGIKVAMCGCDAVLHLAALIAIPFSYHSPDTYIDTNVRGTLNILQSARELNISRIIHTSTSEVYGSAQVVPMSEDHRLLGQSPYSASKIAADHLAYSFYASFDLPVTILRPFNTYGPRQSSRAVIPSIITQFASGINDIRLGALTPTRDFNYIEDTVAGFIAALNSSNSSGEVINIGTGYEVSIGQIVSILAEIMEVNIKVLEDSQRLRPGKSEVLRLCADNTKAKEILNWEPQYSGEAGLRAGLVRTVQWYTSNENLSEFKASTYGL